MRKLMWFTVGFVFGLGACIWFLSGILRLVIAALCGAAALVMGLLYSPGLVRRIMAAVLTGCTVGLIWMCIYESVWLVSPKACNGQYKELSVEITDYSHSTSTGVSASGLIELNGKLCKIKLYVNEDIELQPGDRVDGQFYMRYSGYNAEQSPTYHQGDGIVLLLYARQEPYIFRSTHSKDRYIVPHFRHKLYLLLDELFPEDTAGFARALVLGDSTKLTNEEDNAFQNSGIRHIIAVSGLHISILFSFVYKMVGKREWPTAIIGLPVLFVFAALAGFTPSVVRACVMQGLLILSMVMRKEYDPPTALAFAVLVILGVNPLALASVGFQLSVGCVVGIFLFSGRLHEYVISRKWIGKVSGKTFKAKLKRWFAQSVSVSVSAISLTTPISACYFGAVSTLSVLTNLLTLWAISYIFCGIILSCAVGFFFLPAGSMIAWLVSWPMRYVQLVAKFIADIPYSMTSTDNVYVVSWLFFGYVLVVGMLCCKKKRPVFLLGCICVGLCASLLLSRLEQQQDSYRMTVLDVGQGQCIILQSGNACYVVDCGGDIAEGAADLTAHTLRTQGISRIDGLILTHFDKDHAGGAISLLSQIPVDALYLPDAEPDTQLRRDLENKCADMIIWVRRNTYFPCGDAYISIYPAERGAIGNNSSMTILFQAKKCDILITGDLDVTGEQKLLDAVRLPDIEVLVVGHHGSGDSTSLRLLDAVKPDAAVISVGAENTFGHPSNETLDRLKLFGCRIWRTDQNGTVIFRG